MYRVRVSTVSSELRRRSISPIDGRRHPTATAATNTRHPNGGAASVNGAKVFGGRRSVLVAAQRRWFGFRPPPAPPPTVDGIPSAPPAAAAGHGRRAATTTADVQDDATTATEGRQGATDPETHERVHGMGQSGAEKVGRRKS